MKKIVSMLTVLALFITLAGGTLAAIPTLTNLDITNYPTFWIQDSNINKATYDLGVLNLPSSDGLGMTMNKMYGAKTNLQNYTTSFQMSLTKKVGTALGTTSRFFLVLKSKELNTAYFNGTPTKTAYWLDFSDGSVNLMMGATKILMYCNNQGVIFGDGNYHNYQVTVYDNDVGGVSITLVVDTKTIVNYSNNGTDPIKDKNNNDTGYTDRLLGNGNMQINSTNVITSLRPAGYVAPESINLADQTLYLNLAAGSASYIDPILFMQTGVSKYLTTSRTNIQKFESKFDLKLYKNSGTVLGYASKFIYIIKSKEANNVIFNNTTSKNGYYLDFYENSFNLMMKSKIMKYVSTPGKNLADGNYHSLQVQCYDNADGGVTIKVIIDNTQYLLYQNNSTDLIVDRNGVDTGYTDRMTGDSNIQLYATATQVLIKPMGVAVTNTNPIASDDTASTDKNTATIINVLGNDTDSQFDALTITDLIQPTNGTAVIENGKITYTPNLDYFGSDSFTYKASDSLGGLSDVATVNITVIAPNVAPVASDDEISLIQNSNIDIDVLANDTDANNDSLTIVELTQPLNGVTVIVDNIVNYTPNVGYFGTDSFTYKVNDGNGEVSNVATVSITVNELTAILAFGDYDVSVDNIITNVQPDTTVAEFRTQISPLAAVSVFTNSIRGELQDGDLVGTGTTIEVNLDGNITSYTIVIYGDVDCNGLIGLSDLAIIRDCLLEKIQLTGTLKTAGDLYLENNITLNDLVGIMAYISESGSINQNQII